MSVKIQFLGGAGTVTGSKFLVDTGKTRIMVDCGVFQGLKELRLLNWMPLPIDAASVDAVILTHAHLDHTGYLPLFVKQGFRGHAYCTAPTKDLTQVILKDFAKIQEEDAETANIKGFSKHKPARPLYDMEDCQKGIGALTIAAANKWHHIGDCRFRFISSGHILGSAFVELHAAGMRIVFSGDLGRRSPLILHPPQGIQNADVLVMESTYGDRLHSDVSPQKELGRLINETVRRKGHVIIPSFAVGRTQDILYLLSRLQRQGKLSRVPIYLDSPMAVAATEIFLRHAEWHKLKANDVLALEKIAIMVRSASESRGIIKSKRPSVVIAGSGMVAGGRVLAHLEERLPDRRNSVILVGYQAAGTRGRQLLSGTPEIKLQGKYVPVKAQVHDLSPLSAHADQGEILWWCRHFKKPPRFTFLVHGEPAASDSLRVKLRDTLGFECFIPRPEETFTLD